MRDITAYRAAPLSSYRTISSDEKALAISVIKAWRLGFRTFTPGRENDFIQLVLPPTQDLEDGNVLFSYFPTCTFFLFKHPLYIFLRSFISLKIKKNSLRFICEHINIFLCMCTFSYFYLVKSIQSISCKYSSCSKG